MGYAILALMAVGVVLMLTRVLPTAFVLALLALGIAILAGAPLFGAENSILTTVLQTGSATLAATMIAVLLGSWLGTLMDDTGIAATLVRRIVEFGGEARRSWRSACSPWPSCAAASPAPHRPRCSPAWSASPP